MTESLRKNGAFGSSGSNYAQDVFDDEDCIYSGFHFDEASEKKSYHGNEDTFRNMSATDTAEVADITNPFSTSNRDSKSADQDFKKCKAKMLKLLSVKDFTEFSMCQRLKKDGFNSESIKRSVKFATDNRYIDDKRFANAYVLQKSQGGWGKNKIEKGISKYGIDQVILEEAFEANISEENEVEIAVKLLDKYQTHAKNEGDARYRYLLGKGFSSAVCSKAMRIWRSR